MNNLKKISRREVIKWSVPFFAAAALPEMLLTSSCHSSSKKDTAADHPRRPKKTPMQRGNPYAARDEMFLHIKSKTLHYPYAFKTYDKFNESKFTIVNTGDWEAALNNGAHFSREKSALIFERLALKNLEGGISADNLTRSADILGKCFKTDYAKQNMYNWRGYQLLLQLIALNTSIADTDKWAAFSNEVKDANPSQVKVIDRKNAWVTSQQLFNDRVKYINEHADEYTNRIKKRAV